MHSSEHSHAASDSSFTIYRVSCRIGEKLVSAFIESASSLNFSPALTGGLFLRPFCLRMILTETASHFFGIMRYAASAFISL